MATIFQLGAVTISAPGPFTASEASEDFGSDVAAKPLVGAQMSREFMGEGDGHWTLSGTLFPDFYARAGKDTGLTEIEMLRAITGTGEPQPLMAGGKPLGFWLVEKVTTKHSHLSADGIGRVITYDIQLVRSAKPPTQASLVAMLTALF